MYKQRHEELPELRKQFLATKEVLQHMGVSLGWALSIITNTTIKKQDADKTKETVDKEVLKNAGK